MDYTVVLIITDGDAQPSLDRWFITADDAETAAELAAAQWEADRGHGWHAIAGMVFDGTHKEVW
jgi:hypothetical protein